MRPRLKGYEYEGKEPAKAQITKLVKLIKSEGENANIADYIIINEHNINADIELIKYMTEMGK